MLLIKGQSLDRSDGKINYIKYSKFLTQENCAFLISHSLLCLISLNTAIAFFDLRKISLTRFYSCFYPKNLRHLLFLVIEFYSKIIVSCKS